MNPTENLLLGYISYQNCVPFFHYLKEFGYKGRLVAGVPSSLNRMLAAGELDASPSSSFEYALHADQYALLPGFSISSIGPVNSVLLFSPVPPEQLKGETIALTDESATSIHLLRVLLPEYYGHDRVIDFFPQEPVENLISRKQPGVLIGDRALRQAAAIPEGMICYDLGQLWYEKTGLPFVFALWIVQRSILEAKAQALQALANQLGSSLEKALADLPALAKASGNSERLDEWVSYWQGINYFLTDSHKKGLHLFFTLCEKYGYLKKAPEMLFVG